MSEPRISQRLRHWAGRVLIGGFYGADEAGSIQTFPPGGSDDSGAVLARALRLPYQMWTDINGIYTANPKLVNGVQHLPKITIEEMREMSNGGAQVLSRSTAVHLALGGVTTYVRSTFKPFEPGTYVVPDRGEPKDGESVIAVASRDDVQLIQLCKIGIAGNAGYRARLLEIITEAGLSEEFMPSVADGTAVGFYSEDEAIGPMLEERIRSDAALAPELLTHSRHSLITVIGRALKRADTRTDVMLQTIEAIRESGQAVVDVVSTPNSAAIGLLLETNNRNGSNRAAQAVHDTFELAA